MKKTALIALAAVVSLGLSGCAGSARSSDGGGVAAEDLLVVTPAATKDIDKVKWNSTYGEPANLDPIKAFNYPENTVVSNLCEGLFQIQPDFSFKPNLAEKVEQVSSTEMVYTIRQGVKFWDGAPMTVEDVIFSLERNQDPSEGSYWASSTTKNIESIKQTGDWEVTIKLRDADQTFNDSLATAMGNIVQKKHRLAAGENFGNPSSRVMCTGPYQIADWKQGNSILLDRFDDYWNEGKRAKAAQVEIGFVVDPNAIANALTTGEIDGSYDVPLSAISQLSTSTNGELFFGKGLQTMAVIATGDGAFGDPAVRRALTLATDRTAIAATVFEGTGAASTSIVPADAWSAIPGAEDQRSAELPDLSYNLDGAKAALAEATADISKPIKIVYPSERSFYADVINEMANGADSIGLKVEPVGVPSAQFGAFFSDPKAREGYDGFVTTNYMSISDPLSYLADIAHSGGSQNYGSISEPQIDAALNKAGAEQDPEKRVELTIAAEKLILEVQPWVPIVDLSVRGFLKDGVSGAPASFVYLYYPWAADLGGTGS